MHFVHDVLCNHFYCLYVYTTISHQCLTENFKSVFDRKFQTAYIYTMDFTGFHWISLLTGKNSVAEKTKVQRQHKNSEIKLDMILLFYIHLFCEHNA